MIRPKVNTEKLERLPIPEGTILRIKHVTDTAELKELWLEHTKYDSKDSWERLEVPKYATFAVLYDKETGNELVEGMAWCSPLDAPDRKLGRIIAHNRCIKTYNKVLAEEKARVPQAKA